MRALIQRVSSASVTVEGKVIVEIGKGMLIFLGVGANDDEPDASYLAEKCVKLRIFEDSDAKMNLSVADVNGNVLVVSQFTLYADTQQGNRPSFTEAARPDKGESLYNFFVEQMKTLLGQHRVATGVFRAMMDVKLINDGPVTIMIESKQNNREEKN
jgi:D-aminoacyl-tRNA deacylase